MGPGLNASEKAIEDAYQLGALIAKEGWTVLSGGRKIGVMDAVNRGAKSEGGLTVGIIAFADNENTSESVDIAIVTGMGSGRNNINILSSDVTVVIAESMGAGTSSEAALALKGKKHIILLNPSRIIQDFYVSIGKDLVSITQTPEETIKEIKKIL